MDAFLKGLVALYLLESKDWTQPHLIPGMGLADFNLFLCTVD